MAVVPPVEEPELPPLLEEPDEVLELLALALLPALELLLLAPLEALAVAVEPPLLLLAVVVPELEEPPVAVACCAGQRPRSWPGAMQSPSTHCAGATHTDSASQGMHLKSLELPLQAPRHTSAAHTHARAPNLHRGSSPMHRF